MRNASNGAKETSKLKKPKIDATRSTTVPKLFRAVPFCLEGHSWIPMDWLPHVQPDTVIRTFEDWALVRRLGKRSRMFPEPKQGAEAACAWSEERYQQETQKFLSIDREIEASLFPRAKQKKSGARPMALKARDLIDELFVAAREGNEEAASSVAGLLLGAVIQL